MAKEHNMNLTQKILAYQEAKYPWHNLYKDLYEACTAFLIKQGRAFEEAHEVFFFCLPRLQRIAEKFIHQDSPFEHYLFQCLSWQYRTYKKKLRHKEQQETQFYYNCALSGIGNSYSNDQDVEELIMEPVQLTYGQRIETDKTSISYRDLRPKHRRLLIIALRNFHFLDDEHCLMLADHIGANPQWIFSLVDSLRVRTIDLFNKRQQQKDKQLSRCLLYNSSKSTSRSHLQRKLHAFHKDIAEVLEISKGSVDSSLFYSRKSVI
jgi:hypothetical protein